MVFPPIDWPYLTESQAWAILMACIMMFCDVVTGFACAAISHNIMSSKMREGIFHKAMMLIIIVISYTLGVGLQHVSGCQLNIPTTEVVCIYVVVMEITSVFENIAKVWPEFGESKIYEEFSEFTGGDDNGLDLD